MATAVAVLVQPPRLPGTDITLTKEQADAANAAVRHRIDAMEVEYQLRGIAQENINGLRQTTGLSASSKLLGEAFTGALPILSPFTLPVRFGAYRYTSYQQFRAQGINPNAASLMSTGVAILQLAGDQLRVSALRYGGPVKKFLGKAGTSPVTRISAHWLDAAATGTLLSSATQHLVPGLVQDVASFFDDTVPGTDWKKTTRELIEAAPVTLATMIVMAPVMGGILRAARIKNFDVFARVPEALRRMGFRRAAAERIINAPPGEAGRVFEQTLKENPPDPSSPEPAPARAVPDKSGEAAPPDKTAPVRQTGHTPPDKTTEAPSPDKTAEPAPSPDGTAARAVPNKASEPVTPDKSGKPAPPDKPAEPAPSPDNASEPAAPDKPGKPVSPDKTAPVRQTEPAPSDKTTEAVSPDKSGEPLTPDKTTEPSAADDFAREQQLNEDAGLGSMAPDESGQWHLQTKSGQRLTAGSLENALRMRETMRATRQQAAVNKDKPRGAPNNVIPETTQPGLPENGPDAPGSVTSAHENAVPDESQAPASPGEPQLKMSLDMAMLQTRLKARDAGQWTRADVSALLEKVRRTDGLTWEKDNILEPLTGFPSATVTHAAIREWTNDFYSFIPPSMARSLGKLKVAFEKRYSNKSDDATVGEWKNGTLILYTEAIGTDLALAKETFFHEFGHRLWRELKGPEADAWRASILALHADRVKNHPGAEYWHPYATKGDGLEVATMHLELLSSPRRMSDALQSTRVEARFTLEVLSKVTNILRKYQ